MREGEEDERSESLGGDVEPGGEHISADGVVGFGLERGLENEVSNEKEENAPSPHC